MKRTILTLALALALATTAYAGSYSRSVKIQQVCSERGEVVQQVYEMKEKDNIKLEDFPSTDKQLHKAIVELFKLLEKGKPRSSHEAYMLGWAACMDKFQ